MATTMKPADVVIVGMGWAGSILAKELAQAGLRVVGLERGGPRNISSGVAPVHSHAPRAPGAAPEPEIEADVVYLHDELRYEQRGELLQKLRKETITFRNDSGQTALPMRRWGAFPLGDGVGGSGIHWAGQAWRFLPWDFEMQSQTVARYGKEALPPDSLVQDWPLTYHELEPYYDRWEYTCGISGQAGNVANKVQPGGNPFEGPRAREYPNPPMTQNEVSAVAQKAALALGYHPFPQPAATMSKAYTNPDGVQLGACHYCGLCMLHDCEVYAKATPNVTVLPVALKQPSFELRTNAHVTRINLDSTGKRAQSVTYVDGRGQEIEQPADIVILSAYALNNVRLLLLSNIGRPYDYKTGHGVVGKSYTYQAMTAGLALFEEKVFNTFMGAGGLGLAVDDFNGDNFDHAGLGFIGGGVISFATIGGGPIGNHPTPLKTPAWGSLWKQAVAKYFTRSFSFFAQGGVQAYRGNYLDLDPTYRDQYGQPLLRMTFDWGPNEHAASAYLAKVLGGFTQEIAPDHQMIFPLGPHFDISPSQATHNYGGVVMGADPAVSVTNKYLQAWDVPNLFVVGGSAFPQNPGYNPTETIGALAFWTAEAIKSRYLKAPGKLMV